MNALCMTAACASVASMHAADNGSGAWDYCDTHMRAAIEARSAHYDSYRYVWPTAGHAAATPAQRAMSR